MGTSPQNLLSPPPPSVMPCAHTKGQGGGGLLTALEEALPTGAANGTSVKVLSQRLGVSERTVRDGLRSLVIDHHLPVVTLPTENGVYVALDADDIKPAWSHLQRKLTSLRERMDALERAAQNLAWKPSLF